MLKRVRPNRDPDDRSVHAPVVGAERGGAVGGSRLFFVDGPIISRWTHQFEWMTNHTMSILAKDVKALRDRTGAGMMDCKKALTETDGDIEAAIDLLRAKEPRRPRSGRGNLPTRVRSGLTSILTSGPRSSSS